MAERRRLGSEEIRAALQDRPRRRWNPKRCLVNILTLAGVIVLLWLVVSDPWLRGLIGGAVDYELDRVKQPVTQPPTAQEVRDVAGSLPFDEEDYALIAQVIHAEARGEPYEGQVAVAAVVVNRVNDERFPATVREVVTEPGQFVVSRGQPVDRHLEAAQAALAGEDPSNGALYFYAPELSTCDWIRTRETTAEIGGHRFAR